MSRSSQAEVSETLARCQDALMSLPGVVGVGVGGTADDAHVQVFVDEQPMADATAEVERLLDGLDVHYVGLTLPAADSNEED